MRRWLRSKVEAVYEHVLRSEITETPTHVAVIQDGNRRYAREHGKDPSDGHRAGADTTEQLLEWCDELGIEEVTLYTFSTENFKRPEDEQQELFDLIARKLREFADSDRVHEAEVQIRALGETEKLPERVQEAIAYATAQTESYDNLQLNIALAYGGRAELLSATQNIASRVAREELKPEAIDVDTVEKALGPSAQREVDLIIRSGGDERTSNFLPWQANGNEAAVYFSTPYWPAFRKIDFLRCLRTYGHRERNWRQTRARRARSIITAIGSRTSSETTTTFERFRDSLPNSDQDREGSEATEVETAD